MIVTSFFIALFPRELPRAILRKQLTQTIEASTTIVATTGSQVNLNRAGSKLVLTSEAAQDEDSRIPRISGMHAAFYYILSFISSLPLPASPQKM